MHKQKLRSGFGHSLLALGITLALAQSALAAADNGHISAKAKLADIYYEGRNGVTQDYIQAFKWYEEAAKNEYYNNLDDTWNKEGKPAQYRIALMYDKGLGDNKNQAMAKRWLSISCNNAYQASCDYLQKLAN